MSHPPRRWFQFSLSTWFVLVAILAWAMYLRPFSKDSEVFTAMVNPQLVSPASSFCVPHHVSVSEWKRKLKRTPKVKYDLDDSDMRVWYWRARLTLPRLIYPALALAAFVGWKAAWAIGRRVAGWKAQQAGRLPST